MAVIRFDNLSKLTPSASVKLPALEGYTKGHVLASELVGQNGEDGEDGLSAYQIAVNEGFSGTESEWIDSLSGTDGTNGINAASVSCYVFSSEATRNNYPAWTGMISLQIDTDSYTIYNGLAWMSYTDSLPFYYVGTLDASTVDGHLTNGAIYDEVSE